MDLTGPAGAPAMLGHTDRPLLTYHDDATGERTELSAADLGGWAARTAALLCDGCGLGAGSRAAVLLPPHWQTAAVLLGAWSSGVAVSFRGAATAGLPAYGPGAEDPPDVTFVAAHRVDDWLDDVPCAPHQFVLGTRAPLAEVPAGYRDWLAEAGRYPDDAPAYQAVHGAAAASVDGTSHEEWNRVAMGVAESSGVRRGDRLLIDTAASEHPLMWLLAPLAAGASVVLCANLDRSTIDAKVAAEAITRVLA